jgi:hypothetical protein
MLSRATNAQDKPLLDFVFAVSHPSHWHAINMQQQVRDARVRSAPCR